MENYIVTYNGEKALKKNCRFIKGEFYIKNKQCFNIDGMWYRINSGYIALDHETGKYSLIKGSNMIKGVVSYDPEKDAIVLGYFTPDPYKNVKVATLIGYYSALNKYILPDPYFYFDKYNLQYNHNSIKRSSNWNKINTNGCLSNHPYGELPYNLRNVKEDKIEKVRNISEKIIDNIKIPVNICKKIDKLQSYTYGFEFETNAGIIPANELAESGLIPLRDGSIRGIEYVTLPQTSFNIGKSIIKVCNTLNEFTTISENESLHLHIGNIGHVDKKFVGVFYTLCCVLEDEIFSMFPKLYANTSKFKARGKDYNKPLVKALVDADPLITFDNVSTFLASGKKYMGFGSSHPSDPDSSHKWQVDTRYYFCNLINLLFGNNKTIEFRVHTPSRNPIKLMNWVFICSAIVEYTKFLVKNDISMSSIKGLTLDKIISHVYDFRISSYLSSYIRFRKISRKEDDDSGDYTGAREIRDDMKYNVDFD